MNKHITIRDLQKISARTISKLDWPTPIKVGDETIGAIFPLKKTDPKKMRAVLLRIEKLAKKRDMAADDAALEQFGPVDKTDWSFAATKRTKRRKKRQK
jgi:hypothetical protein